jgi:beta-phosphoglucomutase-like phosphatase (HAD superfamily)
MYDVLPDSDTIEALIFDWDGTLVDSAESNFDALRRALLACDVVLDRDWYFARFSMTTPELLNLWIADFGPLPQPIKMITNRCRDNVVANAANLVIIEEVAAIAHRAHAAGWKLAIGSNSSTATINASLIATGLHTLFPVVVTGSDVTAGKPSPEIFLLAAQQLRTPPEACLVYEDAPDGITAAQAAGMRVVDVRSGLAVPARLCVSEP